MFFLKFLVFFKVTYEYRWRKVSDTVYEVGFIRYLIGVDSTQKFVSIGKFSIIYYFFINKSDLWRYDCTERPVKLPYLVD